METAFGDKTCYNIKGSTNSSSNVNYCEDLQGKPLGYNLGVDLLKIRDEEDIDNDTVGERRRRLEDGDQISEDWKDFTNETL